MLLVTTFAAESHNSSDLVKLQGVDVSNLSRFGAGHEDQAHWDSHSQLILNQMLMMSHHPESADPADRNVPEVDPQPESHSRESSKI